MTLLKEGDKVEVKDEEVKKEEVKLAQVLDLSKIEGVKDMFETTPHKTNVLPKEFEPRWKVAQAKWNSLEEVEATQLIYQIETNYESLTYQGDLGEAKFADAWDDGIYMGELNDDDTPITRDRTYFGQTYEFEGKQIPQGYGRFISYDGDIIEGQLSKGNFHGFVRLITCSAYVHYLKYDNGVVLRRVNFNPWGRRLIDNQPNIDKQGP